MVVLLNHHLHLKIYINKIIQKYTNVKKDDVGKLFRFRSDSKLQFENEYKIINKDYHIDLTNNININKLLQILKYHLIIINIDRIQSSIYYKYII
jgi:hypothetical protein